MENPVQLGRYDNSWFDPGGSRMQRVMWFFVGRPLVRSSWIPSSSMRVRLLRWFGSKVGKGVVLKPSLDVKYPWHLEIGENSWVGEHVWIDNLTLVRLGANVCVSQGAYLCTGNHDWSDPHFGLRVGPIVVEDGGWVGAKVILTPGSRLGICAIASAGSVISGKVPAFHIFAGNPACFVRLRRFPGGASEASRTHVSTGPETERHEASSANPSTRGSMS